MVFKQQLGLGQGCQLRQSVQLFNVDAVISYYTYRSCSYDHVANTINKEPSKSAVDDTFIYFLLYLQNRIRLNFSCESSAEPRIRMKYQVLFFSGKQLKEGSVYFQ